MTTRLNCDDWRRRVWENGYLANFVQFDAPPESVSKVNRRRLLQQLAVVTGAAVAPSVARAILADAPLQEGQTFDAAATSLIGQLAEHIIPETDTPGALAAGVDRYIARLVGHYLPEADAMAYRNGLEALDNLARGQNVERFIALSRDRQLELLVPLDERAFSGDSSPLAEFWRRQKALTIAGYYTSEIGATQELRPMPMGSWDADVPYGQIGRAWS